MDRRETKWPVDGKDTVDEASFSVIENLGIGVYEFRVRTFQVARVVPGNAF